MRLAAARAANRRGSTSSNLPGNASRSAEGRRVVLPAPVLARSTRHGALRNNLTASGSSESIGRIGSAIRSGPWQSQAFLFEAGSNKMNRIALQA